MQVMLTITDEMIIKALEKEVSNQLAHLDIWESDNFVERVYAITEGKLTDIIEIKKQVILDKVSEQIATELPNMISEILTKG